MTIHRPPALPECRLCQTPTRRQTHARTDGLCSACHRTYQASRAVQTQLLLSIPDLEDKPADLANVVMFRPRKAGQ